MSSRIKLFISIILILFGAPGLQAYGSDKSEVITINVDTGIKGKPLRHVWQYYGYDECNYTTAPNAKELMATLADINPGQVYLRQHFLLASGDGTPSLKWSSSNVYTDDTAGNPVYDWRIMDDYSRTI